MRIVKAFLREHIKDICLYTGFIGIFFVIFFLYDIRTDAVNYAFLLSVIWLVLYGVVDFIRYVRRYNKLLEAERKLSSGLESLGSPATLLEEEYQKMVVILYEAKLELESSERISRQAMTDYYSMWVHQIKTPIAAMHVLLQTYDEEHQEEQSYSREMKKELFKVEQYVEMALVYLRMEEMSSDLSFEQCSLDGIVKQAVRKYSQMFILQKIKLNYRPLEKMVLTDEKWLVFVVEQILSNALKYTKRGSISIYLEEGQKCYQGRELLVIEDTGIGIQPEDLPRVFERGFTGYNGRKDKKSTGIGLYLCKSVMDKLQHKIWIESEVGKGTKVYLALEREELKAE